MIEYTRILRLFTRVGPDLVFLAGYRISGRIIRHTLPDIAGFCRMPDIRPDYPAYLAGYCQISSFFLPDNRISGPSYFFQISVNYLSHCRSVQLAIIQRVTIKTNKTVPGQIVIRVFRTNLVLKLILE